jgi:hypothetical protein
MALPTEATEMKADYPEYGDIVSVRRKKGADGELLDTFESFHVYELDQSGEHDRHFVKWSNALDREKFMIPSSFWNHEFVVTGKHEELPAEIESEILPRKEMIDRIKAKKALFSQEDFSSVIEQVMGFGITTISPKVCSDVDLAKMLDLLKDP